MKHLTSQVQNDELSLIPAKANDLEFGQKWLGQVFLLIFESSFYVG